MPPTQKIRADVRLKKRYLILSKLILLIAIIYSLWIAFIIISVYFLGFGNRWAVITMDEWILSAVIILGVFLGFEIFFIFHHYMIRRRRIEQEKPKPLLYHGKEVHNFSLPIGSEGGIFSKTYVRIDEEHIVNIRYQMVPPKELWGKKEE
jgi:hypothetical protein